MRVLVFGDSITQGFFDIEGGWVSRLQRKFNRVLEDDTDNDSPTFFNLGISGDTSQEVVARIDNETNARLWPGEEIVVVLDVGINDSRIDGNIPFSTPEKFRQNLEQAIEFAKKYSKKLLVVGLTPCVESRTTPVCWGANDISWTNQRIQAFDLAAKEAAGARLLPFAEVFEPFQTQLAEHQLMPDGLHPNSAGHQLIADIVGPMLAKLLSD